MKQLGQGLEQLSNLKILELDLQECNLGYSENNLKFLGQSLQKIPNLKDLDLDLN